MLKIPFPDHIFLKISKYHTENLNFPSTGKYYAPPFRGIAISAGIIDMLLNALHTQMKEMVETGLTIEQ